MSLPGVDATRSASHIEPPRGCPRRSTSRGCARAPAIALTCALVTACGRLGYDPFGAEPGDDGGPADGSGADTGMAVPDGGGLPVGCLVVTTAIDEQDPAESPTPPHLGTGLSLREAIGLTNLAPGPGCIGFLSAMALTWTAGTPTIDGPLELHGGGSRLVDASGISSGIIVETGGSGTVVRELAVQGYDLGFDVRAANVTLGPGVEARENNVGVRLAADGDRITGSLVASSIGTGIDVLASNATVELTVVTGSGAAGVATGAGVTGLTLRHVTLDHSAVGCNFRSNPTGVLLRNVVITASQGAGIDTSGATQMDADYVDAFANNVPCSGCTLGASSIFTDPRYLDGAAGDFRLAADSPALDRGFDTGLDVNGSAAGRFNGSAPDLGALER